MLGYANSIRTVDGGTHIDGMKASLTRTINNFGKKSKIIKVTLSVFCYCDDFVQSYVYEDEVGGQSNVNVNVNSC